ncbi:hypothetical protein [Hoeflea poritis]|uniref:Uncharacterized protein n=1 Tax=Hoeflea poritis TaxID=2993659 RepID=A0ABT4VHC9_9HYPH|nr:hypothetical protein [Hoeflea poritis]MDA4844100.1 hypothetical protein [Hoeflea poritis]
MHNDRQPQTLPTTILDLNAKPRGRRGKLDMRQKEALLRSYAGGEPTSALADWFDVDETYIRKLASRHGIRKGAIAVPARPRTKTARKSVNNSHLTAFKFAWRGFHVPGHLEQRYVDLLVRGFSRIQAARKLGLLESK